MCIIKKVLVKFLVGFWPGDSVLEDDDAAVSGILPSRLRADDDWVSVVLKGLSHEVVLRQILAKNLEIKT